jgi:hypothetical protein
MLVLVGARKLPRPCAVTSTPSAAPGHARCGVSGCRSTTQTQQAERRPYPPPPRALALSALRCSRVNLAGASSACLDGELSPTRSRGPSCTSAAVARTLAIAASVRSRIRRTLRRPLLGWTHRFCSRAGDKCRRWRAKTLRSRQRRGCIRDRPSSTAPASAPLALHAARFLSPLPA